ncbi:MAG: hypothetical protein ACR2N5_02585 [Solirubrobacterales bacterium]
MARLTLLLAALALGVGVAACGGGDSDSDAEANGNEAQAEMGEREPAGTDSSAGGPADEPQDGGGDKGEADGDGQREKRADRPDEGEGPGGSGKKRKPSDEKQIRAAITGFLVSGEAEIACGEAVTEGFLRQAYGDRQGCIGAQTSGGTARSVRVERLDVEGATAFAIGVPKGGASAGQRLEIDLVKKRGQWRIDNLFADVPVGP